MSLISRKHENCPTCTCTNIVQHTISFSTAQEIEKGQKWYIKHIGASTIRAVKITDVTDLTVELKGISIISTSNERYKRQDIEFVEQLK